MKDPYVEVSNVLDHVIVGFQDRSLSNCDSVRQCQTVIFCACDSIEISPRSMMSESLGDVGSLDYNAALVA